MCPWCFGLREGGQTLTWGKRVWWPFVVYVTLQRNVSGYGTSWMRAQRLTFILQVVVFRWVRGGASRPERIVAWLPWVERHGDLAVTSLPLVRRFLLRRFLVPTSHALTWRADTPLLYHVTSMWQTCKQIVSVTDHCGRSGAEIGEQNFRHITIFNLVMKQGE